MDGHTAYIFTFFTFTVHIETENMAFISIHECAVIYIQNPLTLCYTKIVRTALVAEMK